MLLTLRDPCRFDETSCRRASGVDRPPCGAELRFRRGRLGGAGDRAQHAGEDQPVERIERVPVGEPGEPDGIEERGLPDDRARRRRASPRTGATPGPAAASRRRGAAGGRARSPRPASSRACRRRADARDRAGRGACPTPPTSRSRKPRSRQSQSAKYQPRRAADARGSARTPPRAARRRATARESTSRLPKRTPPQLGAGRRRESASDQRVAANSRVLVGERRGDRLARCRAGERRRPAAPCRRARPSRCACCR